jgi:type I restriction enzyme, R subunit
MPLPGEHKTVQARILGYAQEIGWTFVPRAEAESRRGFDPAAPDFTAPNPAAAAHGASLYFEDLLHAKVREFNPAYSEGPGALPGILRRQHTDIYGNRELLRHLRNQATFFCPEENRELNLTLVDFEHPERNVYEVSEEFAVHNGLHGTREDVVFLVNGIPVLVIECKNADKDEAIALGIDQIRRYHDETPEVMVPQMLFTATEAIGFSYGVTWSLARRNIFTWKDEQVGQLEAKVKSFCAIPHVLELLGRFILFAEKDEELQKYILRQHQAEAVRRVVARALDPAKRRGLVWHTQGSGKTFTMIKAAELLFKAPQAEKPTILLMIDRNELEDQMLRNLAMLGLENVEHANRVSRLVTLLRNDYRGIIVSMIHKFDDMPPGICERENVYVLIDEAHRTTGGDLGNYLFAALPNATMIGFTGTPIDKTAYGKGTFKTFGADDHPQGYLHKYSIAESIEDGTTLPLFYALAPNELLANSELMQKEFWSLAETEGVADIAELNKILERAVNLKNFLKADDRVDKVARYVAEHYRANVEPLGYKAFLVAVDRPACAKYKKALDRYLPAEYSAVVYTGNHNDSAELKAHHLEEKDEKAIRKQFAKYGTLPKILIVTEKLLTGYDAPVLYAMYLDKPMRDHTLLQAIARVNRPYERPAETSIAVGAAGGGAAGGAAAGGGAAGMGAAGADDTEVVVKPHGFVLDFVGIFDKLEKALAFDSDEVNAIVKDLALLKGLFRSKMETVAPDYLALVTQNFNDKDVDRLIEHFLDKERRKEFFRHYKEIEMLYEIISPDAFLSPFLAGYATLSAVYAVVRRAYAKQVYVDRDFQRKTNDLVQQHVGAGTIGEVQDFVEIGADTVELIKNKQSGDATKVINLVKSIEKAAMDEGDDPYLVAMAERARAVQESFEDRQTTTAEALASLFREIEHNEQRKKKQAEKGFDGLTFFVYRTLLDAGVPAADEASAEIKAAFGEHPNWRTSEAGLRELRTAVTFAVLKQVDDPSEVARIVDTLLNLLLKAYAIG